MNSDLEKLNQFIEKWRELLERQAGVLFEARILQGQRGTHIEIADRLVKELGLSPIGVNWEMLDDTAAVEAPRSALGAFNAALTNNMTMSSTEWLGSTQAAECGAGFIECFDPVSRVILTNRLDIGWNPISAAPIEWAFVGFDDRKIALLLVMTEG